MELREEMIDEVSMVFPCDEKRVALFLNTLAKYQQFGIPEKLEIVVASRTFKELKIPGFDIKVVHYKHEGEYFCPSLALNLGVKATKYRNVIIGHPEVKPMNNVLGGLFASPRGNYVCTVVDLAECGCQRNALVTPNYRGKTPGLYFLACYRKEDIEAINGWDMRFMQGYSNEDIDFGQRMVNASIPFTIRGDLLAEHQWHQRGSDDCDGYRINRAFYNENKENKVTWVKDGLAEVTNG